MSGRPAPIFGFCSARVGQTATHSPQRMHSGELGSRVGSQSIGQIVTHLPQRTHSYGRKRLLPVGSVRNSLPFTEAMKLARWGYSSM